jgi:hypothetical protein
MITWYFDETSLSDLDIAGGREISDLSSTFDLPPMRGDNPTLPLREGRLYVPKYYDQRVIALGMWVSGRTAEELDAQMDDLKALLAGGQKLLKRVDSTTATRQGYAEVTGGLGFQKINPHSGKLVVSFLLADPFLYDSVATVVEEDVTASPLEFDFIHPGSAPARKAVIILTGPLDQPKLTNTTNGTWVQYLGTLATDDDYMIIDCGAFTAVRTEESSPELISVIGSIRHDGDPAFLRLDAGTNALKLESDDTGGVIEISLYAPYL